MTAIKEFTSNNINIFVIKTVHTESPYQMEFDPKEYYTDEHVIQLKQQIDANFSLPYTFWLVTNQTTIAMPGINIIDVSHEDLWGWWNKMLLFREDISGDGLNIYFDLDTVIQNNFDSIIDYAVLDKLTMLYCYWKPIDWESQAFKVSDFDPDFEFATLINSSIMLWHGKRMHYITELFMEDPEAFVFKFRGNDEYLNKFHRDIINTLPRFWAYSYFFGAEEGSEFFPKDKASFHYRHGYFFRLLNGQGKKYNDLHRENRRLAAGEPPDPHNPIHDIIRQEKETVVKIEREHVIRSIEYY